jgi:hypothetical protein
MIRWDRVSPVRNIKERIQFFVISYKKHETRVPVSLSKDILSNRSCFPVGFTIFGWSLGYAGFLLIAVLSLTGIGNYFSEGEDLIIESNRIDRIYSPDLRLEPILKCDYSSYLMKGYDQDLRNFEKKMGVIFGYQSVITASPLFISKPVMRLMMPKKRQ